MTSDPRTQTPAPSRPPGRPRSERAHRAILEAAVDLFTAEGFKGMSIEDVAARAGVGKATIYRRWSSKEELLAEALASLNETVPPIDTGTVRGDLSALVGHFLRMSLTTKVGLCMVRTVAELGDNPNFAPLFRARVMAPRRRLAAGALRRGVERGEIRPDVDIELAIDMIIGPTVFRRITGAFDEQGPGNFPELLVDNVVRGLAVAVGAGAPGQARPLG